MLKVLHVLGSLNMGGAEVMALTMAENMAPDCRSHFLVFDDGDGPLRGRVDALQGEVHRMPPPASQGLRTFVDRFSTLLETQSFDAVHSHVNLASGFVMLAAERASVPVRVAHSHNASFADVTWRRWPYVWVSKALIRRFATNCVACGRDAGVNLFGKAWQARGGVVLPNAIQVERFVDARDRREVMRGEWDVAESTTALGVIGRLMPVKNHHFLLDVMEVEARAARDTILLIVGDGPLRRELEQAVRDRGLGQRVRFLGLRTDIPDILGALDVLVMPSFHEGLPVTLVEAQAAGLPALVSDRVTHECDLGLGLIEWLGIERAEAWSERLRITRHRPDRKTVTERLTASGYEASSSAGLLMEIYRGGVGA